MITVFTSSYNHGKYLPYAIESVLNQSYTDFEYILINDGSTDNTLEVMHSYKDPRIKIIDLPKQVNKGPVINRSIQEAKGDVWVWMPADDVFDLDLLKEKLNYSRKLSTESIIYSDYYYINEKGEVTGESKLISYTPETLADAVWRTTNLIGFTGIWIPISILKRIPFPEHIKYSEDFYWLIKSTMYGYDYFHLRKRLYYKRKHKDSVTAKNLQAILVDVENIRKELSL